MEIIELENKKMLVTKELADISLTISGMKAELQQLLKEKETLLAIREEEAKDRIHALIGQSRTLLDEIHSNYEQAHQFYNVVKDFAQSLSEIRVGFTEVIQEHSKDIEFWNEEYKKQSEEIIGFKKEIKADQERIFKDKDWIKQQKKDLQKEAQHIESQQKTLTTSYKALKKLWEKIK